MRLPNQPNPALHKRVHQRILRLVVGIFSLPLIALAGCSGGAPGPASLKGFFSGLSPFQSPGPTATETPTASPTPTPAADAGHQSRKATRSAHAAAKASNSAAAIEGGRHNEVSLEPNTGAAAARATPAAAGSAASAPSMEGTPTLSSSSLEPPESAGDGSPAKAAKLIDDVDRIEKRVDRQSLTADDSQRDILAQKLLLEAKGALTERDTVAAVSLANKASTLLAPLPKLAESTIPSTP